MCALSMLSVARGAGRRRQACACMVNFTQVAVSGLCTTWCRDLHLRLSVTPIPGAKFEAVLSTRHIGSLSMRNGGVLMILLALLGGGLALLLLNTDGMIAGLSEDDFARLVYLGAILTAVGGTVIVAFRGRLADAVRNALLWAAAFVVLIGVYAYSTEFRSVGERMLGALMPGRIVASGNGDNLQVSVGRGFDNHFRVDATINGVELPVLVDTGASTVALDRDTARRVGIDVDGLSYDAQVRTANGVASAAMVRLDSVAVGPIERRNVTALVTANDAIGVGLLGMSFLGQLASVEFRGDRLILTDR